WFENKSKCDILHAFGLKLNYTTWQQIHVLSLSQDRNWDQRVPSHGVTTPFFFLSKKHIFLD
ncbi:hypothetical protein ACJX0J_037454, partial [Zea mays]